MNATVPCALNLPDLVAASLARRPERKTHGGLHISDVANGCPRAVWHRLHRGLDKVFEGDVLKKMEYGRRWETAVSDAAFFLPDAKMREPEAVVFHPNGSIAIVPVKGFEAFPGFDEEPSAYASPDDLVGHPDFVLDTDGDALVVEVKTTMLFYNRAIGGVQHKSLDELRESNQNYILQTAAYGKAYDARTAILYVSDRGTGKDAQYEIDVEREWPLFEERWNFMRQCLNPDLEPAAEPPPWTSSGPKGSYLCRSCPALTCSLNKAVSA